MGHETGSVFRPLVAMHPWRLREGVQNERIKKALILVSKWKS